MLVDVQTVGFGGSPARDLGPAHLPYLGLFVPEFD